jgi:hypothetical protein
VGNLSGCVHAGVGSSGDGQPKLRLTKDGRQRVLDYLGDRALTRLTGPANEGGAVVGQVQSEPDHELINVYCALPTPAALIMGRA